MERTLFVLIAGCSLVASGLALIGFCTFMITGLQLAIVLLTCAAMIAVPLYNSEDKSAKLCKFRL